MDDSGAYGLGAFMNTYGRDSVEAWANRFSALLLCFFLLCGVGSLHARFLGSPSGQQREQEASVPIASLDNTRLPQ